MYPKAVMGLAFWRTYHEQQLAASAEKEVERPESPVEALGNIIGSEPEPEAEAPAEAPEEPEESASVEVAVPRVTRSSIAERRKVEPAKPEE